MKDSVTSGLPLKKPIAGAEASGSGEPLMPKFKGEGYAHDGEDIVIEKENGPCGQ